MIQGSWINANILTTTSTTVSNAVDLGRVYDKFVMKVASGKNLGTATFQAAESLAGTYATIYAMGNTMATSTILTTSNALANSVHTIPSGPFRFVKVVCGDAQANANVARLCGFRD